MNIGIAELESNFTPLPPALAAQGPNVRAEAVRPARLHLWRSIPCRPSILMKGDWRCDCITKVQQLGVPVNHSNVGWFDVAVDPSQPICART